MFKNFKQFLLRGNVVDLAVAVVIGAAFSDVVKTLVSSLITPLIAALVGKPDFSRLSFTLHHSTFTYGVFLNSLISFLLVAAVIFFVIVEPMNKLIEYSNKRRGTQDPTTRECPECLSEVPLKASRCKFCTGKLTRAN